ncbi:Thioredoxin [Alkalibacterium putridalgicola]|uniref:Thioredoxin n=1 Tax=Alkalibacterium putridalgicola TaxID=426703 RepID=A0A1H7R184_9LACT|nr:thioredoxin domain-containing protein [Alkalibacterium putridalgicola]GEK89022.1 thioredoxin [Alkalibacterium putridalgicola]SEL53902.1 Thioredoxin [Alkalibacterium putridalgicola]
MDTSAINSKNVTTKGGLLIGDDKAPVKIVEFINLRCPYSKEWWENSLPLLDKYVKESMVQRIVKHFDKDTPGLKKGNVLHRFLDHSNPEQAKEDITYYFAHLDEWGNLPEDAIAEYAKEKRHAAEQTDREHAESIIEETEQANITLVPTIVLNDHIFDENISEEELDKLIKTELAYKA